MAHLDVFRNNFDQPLLVHRVVASLYVKFHKVQRSETDGNHWFIGEIVF